jgi:predicted anti-sigma-YlaC factor YlaD
MKHYTLEELDQNRHGNMGPLATLRCRIHLRRCEACRKLLGQLAEDDSFLLGVRKATDTLAPYECVDGREDATRARLERKIGGIGTPHGSQ